MSLMELTGLIRKTGSDVRSELRALNSRPFAKRVEGLFLPSNVVIMFVLAIASYIFVFGPGAHPTSTTVLLFVASLTVSFFIMELIRKHTNENDSEKFNITSLRLTITSIILSLIIIRAVGMPQIFVFSTITLLVMSPLVYFIRSKWKISGHMCTFTAMTTIMSMLSAWFTPLFLLIPVISWSRMKLKAHTAEQVLIGTLLGFLVPSTFALLMHAV